MPIIFPPTGPGSTIDVETLWQRRQTEAFIAADPRTFTLYRYPRVSNGRGGYTEGARVDIFEQVFRLIPANAEGLRTERTLPDGRVVLPEWVLLGEWNCEMRRGDRFVLPDEGVCEIIYVQEKRTYQTKGEVILRGQG